MGFGGPDAAATSDMLPAQTQSSIPASTANMAAPGSTVPTLREVLLRQDSVTSKRLIEMLQSNPAFVAFAKAEGAAILARDTEDGEKLGAGIAIAIEKGVLRAQETPPVYTKVDVLGKSAEEVAEALLGELGPEFKSGVIVLVGLSGTGKGTTVDMLKGRLPRATTWSNGNIFRALTLLAVTHCLQQGLEFNQAALTPTNLALWMGMLSFEHRKADGVVVSAPSCQEGSGFFDTRICGLGLDLWVSDVCNTVLKGPMVGKNIPTVAELTQGEVVAFASNACQAMGDAGICVLLEGREQTVNYIASPHRFELIMSDAALIGMRRAAQRVGAKAVELLGEASEDTAVEGAVAEALKQLAAAK